MVNELSTATVHARVKRLLSIRSVDSNCTPAERITQLKSRIEGDERAFRRPAAFFSAFADATRLKVLRVIGDEELCACEVMAALDLTQPTTSHHLGILEKAGILSSRRRGKWVFYRISSPKIKKLLIGSFNMADEIA